MTIKSKLYICVLLSISIIAINCKKSTEPELTLADRAGTYTYTNKQSTLKPVIVVNKDGTGTYTGSASTVDITIGNPASTDTSFTFDIQSIKGHIIDFKNKTLFFPSGSSGGTTGDTIFYLVK